MRLIILILLFPLFSNAQIKVFDKKTYTWQEAEKITDSVGNGYHLPSPKQLDSLFNISYDKSLMASTITNRSVYSSDSSIVGIMRGRKFTAMLTMQEIGSGQPLRYSFILIK